jgi:hypothetical protein
MSMTNSDAVGRATIRRSEPRWTHGNASFFNVIGSPCRSFWRMT